MNIRIIVICVAIIASMLLSGAESFAETNAVATGNWSDPLTWSGGEPTTALPAVVNGGFTVTIDQSGETTNSLDVGTVTGQTGNLNMIGGDLFITDPDTVTAPNLPSIRLGQAAGSTGNFTMSAGTVFIDGANPSGFAVGDLLVGDNGTGTMTLSGGDFSTNDEIVIGTQPGSSGTVTVSGGTFKSGGRSLLVGFGGTGTLNVKDTGFVRANFDLLVGLNAGSTATINQSGGTIEAGFMFSNAFTGAPGSTVNMSMTGGTFNARIAYVMGQGQGTSTLNHSGGAINCTAGNGDFVVSDGNGNTSTYNVSGTASVNTSHDFILGTFNGSNGTVNQTGGAITTARAYRIGADATGVWNISGGTMGGGSVFLGDFDDSFGTLKISGGSLSLTDLSVGAALASNAPPTRVEPDGTNGPQGQALGAHGTLIVSGAAATISLTGNFLANPSDKSSFRRDPFAPGGDNTSNLVFEIFNGSGTSTINTAGIADLDGAVVDIDLMSGYTPSVGTTFDLIKASMFGSTGTGTTQSVGTGKGYSLLAEDVGVFSLAVVASGGGEVLRATFLGAGGVQGDYNGNGIVDAADYVLWRKGGTLMNDPTPGVQPADYTFWRSRFGATSGSGSEIGRAPAVPEPATCLLLVIGSLFSARRSKGRVKPTGKSSRCPLLRGHGVA
jgi:T5SS/PEP-CTERM-associated repeat protein